MFVSVHNAEGIVVSIGEGQGTIQTQMNLFSNLPYFLTHSWHLVDLVDVTEKDYTNICLGKRINSVTVLSLVMTCLMWQKHSCEKAFL